MNWNHEFESDFIEILYLLNRAQKRTLNLPPLDLSPKENVDIYYDISRYLKILQLIPDLDVVYCVDTESGISSENLVGYLFDDGFINYDINDDTVEYFLNSLTVPKLKHILRLNGLKAYGRKQDLIDEIIENDIYRSIRKCDDEILLTDKALKFLGQWDWILDYSNIFRKFHLQDFFSYQYENVGEIKDIAICYLDEHMELAMNNSDFDYILDCLSAKSAVYKHHHDCDNYLDYQMKLFNFIFNPSILADSFIPSKYRINADYLKEFKKLNKLFNRDRIWDSFNKNWDFLNIGKDIVSKEELEILLEKILDKERNEDLMRYIKRNIFITDYYRRKDSEELHNRHINQSNLNDYF